MATTQVSRSRCAHDVAASLCRGVVAASPPILSLLHLSELRPFFRPLQIIRSVRLLGLLVLGAAIPASGSDLTVMSYNILRPEWAKPSDPPWESRVGGVARIIETHKPDIVGLQEETESMVANLLAQLPDYAYTSPVPPKGAGFLYRFRRWSPVHYRREETPAGRSIGELLARDAAGHEVYFYNAHFSPFEERLRMTAAETLLKMIAQRPRQNLPVIVTGDLNATPGSPPLKCLTGSAQGLADVFAAPGSESEQTSNTYDGKWKRKIDHILFSGPLTPLDRSVLRDRPDGIFPSDHLPVLARFSFSK